MPIPAASEIAPTLENLRIQANSNLSWLAYYHDTAKRYQKTAEAYRALLQRAQATQGNEHALVMQAETARPPVPEDLFTEHSRWFRPDNPTGLYFRRTFRKNAVASPTHQFGHYLNLSVLVVSVALLEEFVEQAYAGRTGGAKITRANRSRGLKQYVAILDYDQKHLPVQPPLQLAPKGTSHVVVKDFKHNARYVVHLAGLRNKAVHQFSQANFNLNVATIIMPNLERAIEFVNYCTDALIHRPILR
jgi:hypothetical protein